MRKIYKNKIVKNCIFYYDDMGEVFLKEILPYKMSKSFNDLWFKIQVMLEEREDRIKYKNMVFNYTEGDFIDGEQQFEIYEVIKDLEGNIDEVLAYVVTKENSRYSIFLP